VPTVLRHLTNPALDFSFLDHAEGGDLPLSIIAHDKDVQLLMDSMQISWGVQWEIARGVSKNVWKWSDVTREKLDLLKGPKC
jgi:RNA-dependent RNA polymerase